LAGGNMLAMKAAVFSEVRNCPNCDFFLDSVLFDISNLV
jgi:hypothetical protein